MKNFYFFSELARFFREKGGGEIGELGSGKNCVEKIEEVRGIDGEET